MNNKNLLFFLLITSSLFLTNCKKDDDGEGINVFSLEDDKKFGKQMSDYIESDTSGYVVLDSAQYASAYQYLYGIRNYILQSNEVRYKNEFPYRIRIIKDDSTLNAFALPGGYLYVYTGIIKYLNAEDHLAGVLAHEIAHSDRRHSTQQMTQQYGIQTLFSIVLGENPGMLAQIAAGLASLKFSREDESEADSYSVKYLCQNPAKYEADGAAGFFQQLIDEGNSGGTPEFLSTHPNPDNRVENIASNASTLGCDTQLKDPVTYDNFKNMLP